jgi:hypothetical protein
VLRYLRRETGIPNGIGAVGYKRPMWTTARLVGALVIQRRASEGRVV